MNNLLTLIIAKDHNTFITGLLKKYFLKFLESPPLSRECLRLNPTFFFGKTIKLMIAVEPIPTTTTQSFITNTKHFGSAHLFSRGIRIIPLPSPFNNYIGKHYFIELLRYLIFADWLVWYLKLIRLIRR
mgnify:CR=1 FL=1